jgi:flagellar biogenesis protein FliO
MLNGRNQNFPHFRAGLLDLNSLGSVIGRWFSFGGRRSGLGTAVQHLGTLPLTPQSSLALVRVYKETLVLGITAQSVTLLARADADSCRAGETIAHPAPEEAEDFGSFANAPSSKDP